MKESADRAIEEQALTEESAFADEVILAEDTIPAKEAAPAKEANLPLHEEQEAIANTRRKRKLAIALSSAGVLVIVAVLVFTTVFSSPALTTIEDPDTPLSSGDSSDDLKERNTSSGSRSSGSSGEEKPDADASDSPDSEADQGGSSGTGNGSTGGGTNGGSSPGSPGSPGGSNSGLTWYPPYDEQVWVDTSGYQDVYVGENPIIEYHDICSTCGLIVDGFGPQHQLETGHGSYYTTSIQVGSTPIYQRQWVTSGYYTTIHHEGYWG